jgi:F-box protein 21
MDDSSSPRGIPKIPQEIYIDILYQLPAERYCDDSVLAITACASASSSLRAAATTLALWRPHYLVRYPHCRSEKHEEEEEMRKWRCGGDWRKMYIERRKVDKEAYEVVDSLILCQWRRKRKDDGSLWKGPFDPNDKPLDEVEATRLVHECLREMVKFGVAVLDALDVLEQAPVPPWFRMKHEKPVQYVPQHALPRRYWAAALRGLIVRHDAVTLWVRMRFEGGRTISMERAFAGLTAFFGIGYLEVCKRSYFHWT